MYCYVFWTITVLKIFAKILKEILAMMSLLQACNWVNQVVVAVIIRSVFPVNFAFVSSKFKVWKFNSQNDDYKHHRNQKFYVWA